MYVLTTTISDNGLGFKSPIWYIDGFRPCESKKQPVYSRSYSPYIYIYKEDVEFEEMKRTGY